MAEKARKRITLGDVAGETGYTINTVSRALRDKPDIALETRIRIQETAERMGYVRNVMASSLRSGRTRTLGVILGTLENPYYAVMADQLNHAAEKKGYTLVVLCSRDDVGRELQMANTAIGHQMDGILLFPTAGSLMTVQRMREAGMPFVLLARSLAGDQEEALADSVIGDDAHGAYLAAKHLIEHGRRKLGYLSLEDVTYATAERLKGFRRACREAGIPEEEIRLSVGDARRPGEIVREWLRAGLDGLCAFCDAEAWSVVSDLTEKGVRIPRDLAVIGFDNIQENLRFPWPICSVGFDMGQFAETAVQMIRDKIHHPDSPPRRVILPFTLVCRGSCGEKKDGAETAPEEPEASRP